MIAESLILSLTLPNSLLEGSFSCFLLGLIDIQCQQLTDELDPCKNIGLRCFHIKRFRPRPFSLVGNHN
jgi:hypothetical protein